MWSIGLIGHPVSQSFSPEYFRQKFEDLGLSNWAYKAFDLTDLNTFNTWWQTQNRLVALNVTIPHKQNIIAHCSKISDQVNRIGAANLIIQSAERPDQFKAFNTDHSGFAEALSEAWGNDFYKAVILGSGGSSKAIQFALQEKQIPYTVASRSGSNAPYEHIDFRDFDLIINCTPIGLPSQWSTLPIPTEHIKSEQHFFDLNYHGITPSMQCFLDHGAKVSNGLNMLKKQADQTWEFIKINRPDCFI